MSEAGKARPVDNAGSPSQDGRRRLGARISTALMLGFGLLVFLAVASVLLVGLWSAQRNTLDLLSDKAELALSSLVEQTRSHLDPVIEGNAFLARLMTRGDVDPSDAVQLVDYMTGTMAATPQVRGMGFIDPNFMITRAIRAQDGIGIRISDWSGDATIARMMDFARTQTAPYWGELFWSEEARTTLLNRRAPIRRNGKFLGVLVTTVSVADLSAYIARQNIADVDAMTFILYGSDHVLAHPSMMRGGYALSDTQPLPTLEQLGDPVLANIWKANARRSLRLRLHGNTSGHGVAVDGKVYIVLFRQVKGYSDLPLRVGAYVLSGPATVGREMNRLILSAAVGLVILLVSVTAALILGRLVSRPITRLAQAAHEVRGLDLSGVPHLARSRLRELDEAAAAFNSMVAGLKWFETYVPRTLVRFLLDRGEEAAIASEERTITVLFTDIESFTSLAENKTGPETASFLNEHFSLIAACVEAEGGTVDKYMGDSVMAFWGAPIADPHGVDHACRAALAIRRAITIDNESRRRRAEQPIRLRIGIHTGRAVVGNIGAPGRINYTLVGDTVNVAQRLQQLIKEIGSGAEVEILISGDVADRLGEDYTLTPQGSQPIIGREGALEVYRLD